MKYSVTNDSNDLKFASTFFDGLSRLHYVTNIDGLMARSLCAPEEEPFQKCGIGGKPGQWSARKAQLAVQEYKKKGGKYVGNNRKKTDLHKWTKEDWGTRSGRPSIQGKKASGERYLPRKAREALSKKEYKRTTAAKRRGIKKGKQFVRQPKKIAKKIT
mgnify:CR=1 FL=1